MFLLCCIFAAILLLISPMRLLEELPIGLVAWETAAITMVLFTELGLGAIRLEPGSLTGSDLGPLVAELSLSAAIEELIFRVLLLSGLAVVLSPIRGGRWIAVVLSAALFGIVHLGNPGASWIAAVGTGLGGVMYGVAFLGTRSFWLPFGLHLGWNLSQGLLGFPISGYLVPGLFRAVPTADNVLLNDGGAYGPEAGIPGMLARFVVIGLVLVYLRLRWPAGRFETLSYAPDPVWTGHPTVLIGRAP